MADPNLTEQEIARKRKVQDDLDQALADSFPASDPVSLVTSQHEEWDEEEHKGSVEN